MFRILLIQNKRKMNNIRKTNGKARQIVVFDQIGDTYPSGVLIERTSALKRFADGVIPAGTMVMKTQDGAFKVFDDNVVGEHIGLTHSDIVIDDYPQVSVVMSGIARLEALPQKEQEIKANIKTYLPRISLV